MKSKRLAARQWQCVPWVQWLWRLSAALAPGDWPQWRGPNRDGVSPETGLLKTWPAQGPALLWKTKGLGAGFSGVSVVGDKIFTMGDATDASFIYGLRESDGKQLWSAKVGKTGGDYAGPRCTRPSTANWSTPWDNSEIYVCVEGATGKERWRKSLASDFGGKVMSGWGFAESPLVDGDKLICTPGGDRGTLLALNKTTGAEIWRTKGLKESASYSSIIVAEIGGKRQYIQLTDASVFGVEAQSGNVLWRAPRRGQHGGDSHAHFLQRSRLCHERVWRRAGPVPHLFKQRQV